MKIAPTPISTRWPVAHRYTIGRTVTYTYDGLQRLLGAGESSGTTFAYGYDLAGNRTAVQLNGGTPTTTTYNAANQITSADFTYEALGRMSVRGATTDGYNGDGTLVYDVTTRYR